MATWSRFIRIGMGFLVCSLLVAACDKINSDSVIFQGKTITIIVPYGKGGGIDTYARTIAPYLQKYLPGSSVVVVNLTEEGGMKAKNELFTAEPDGLTLGFMPMSGVLLSEWAGVEGVKYQTEQFTYIGRLNSDNHILVASPKSGLTSVEDFIAAKEIRMGFSGIGSDDYYVAMVTAKLLGFQVDAHTEYTSSNDAGLACVKGDVDAILFSDSSLRAQIDDQTLVPVISYTSSRISTLPDVPTIFEEIPTDKQELILTMVQIYGLDRTMIAPPDMSEERLKALRHALDQAVSDPEYLAAMEKINRPVNYLNGQALESLLEGIIAMKDQIKPYLAGLH